jgi:hypothetical protein
MAPRLLRTQKWFDSTVRSEPFMMSFPGWCHMRTLGPIISPPSPVKVEITFRKAI